MIRDIEQGKIMVVSDLHGNGFDYRQIQKIYQRHKDKGTADYLVFLGDLIHSYPGKKDESKTIVQDLIDRGANTPGSDIICLIGNHELVHIYHIPLVKGHLEFTTWFERRISNNRQHFINFFQQMPFALRTSGGVLIHHTGASKVYAFNPEVESRFDFSYFKNFSHQATLEKLAIANPALNPFGAYDYRIGQAFMDTPEGDWLWEGFMTGNELQYGNDYHAMVKHFLQFMSTDRQEKPLKVLVSGHIGVEYGAECVGIVQLRLCSSEGCGRDLEKKYLLLPANQSFENATQLMEYSREVY